MRIIGRLMHEKEERKDCPRIIDPPEIPEGKEILDGLVHIANKCSPWFDDIRTNHEHIPDSFAANISRFIDKSGLEKEIPYYHRGPLVTDAQYSEGMTEEPVIIPTDRGTLYTLHTDIYQFYIGYDFTAFMNCFCVLSELADDDKKMLEKRIETVKEDIIDILTQKNTESPGKLVSYGNDHSLFNYEGRVFDLEREDEGIDWVKLLMGYAINIGNPSGPYNKREIFEFKLSDENTRNKQSRTLPESYKF